MALSTKAIFGWTGGVAGAAVVLGIATAAILAQSFNNAEPPSPETQTPARTTSAFLGNGDRD